LHKVDSRKKENEDRASTELIGGGFKEGGGGGEEGGGGGNAFIKRLSSLSVTKSSARRAQHSCAGGRGKNELGGCLGHGRG